MAQTYLWALRFSLAAVGKAVAAPLLLSCSLPQGREGPCFALHRPSFAFPGIFLELQSPGLWVLLAPMSVCGVRVRGSKCAFRGEHPPAAGKGGMWEGGGESIHLLQG